MRTASRRLWMGLATLLGVPRGFFSPYRYAEGVAPIAYPELERIFQAAEPAFADVLGEISTYRARLSEFDGPPPRPRWDQYWFPRLDGAAAYAIVQMTKPRRIVEVGSGHSTRMLAQAAADAGGAEITCIDPAPRAALKGLDVTWREGVLGAGDLPLFDSLEAGDIAFFDGSHLLWPGTDVDLILNRILPALRPGVLIHLHDISLPDPYPIEWAWRGYTEQLGLGGWIAGQGVKLVFSSQYVRTRMAVEEAILGLPMPEGALETSLWLRRSGDT